MASDHIRAAMTYVMWRVKDVWNVSVLPRVNIFNLVRFQVLTAMIMKFKVFWDETPCSQVDADRRLGGAYCLYHQDDEAVSTSETSVYFYETTRRIIPGDYLHTRRLENLKSHVR
jgi:hypothetical protein